MAILLQLATYTVAEVILYTILMICLTSEMFIFISFNV